MPQDAFTLRHIARELDDALRGARINKIVQPNKDEADLIVYTGRRTRRLALDTNASDCGAYFDDSEAEAPLVAPNFCMLLRKHIQGAEILSVRLVGFERILCFSMRGSTEFATDERRLYLEVMGKYSNLILCDGQDVILGALKTTSLDTNSKRMIFAGVKYLLPAPQEGKIDPSDRAALADLLQTPPADLGRLLFTRIAGLAPVTAEQIAANYRGGDLADYVYEYLFSDMVCPCAVMRDGIPVDFSARAVEGARPFATLSEAQSYFYAEKRRAKKFEGMRKRCASAVSAAAKKHEKRLAQILEKKKECADCEQLRIKGEVLTANLYALSRGMKGAELDNWYDGTRIRISLDARLTPSENAQSYFKRYRKQKRTLEILGPQEAETRAELDYLSGLAAALSSAESEEDLLALEEELIGAGLAKEPQKRTKKRAEIPFRTFTAGGFHIFAGRNNLQNDRLVRTASPDDLWLHAQRYHSCHVIVKTEGKSVPEEVLQFAADVCAKYSDSRGDRVPVDCCRVKFVKKPKGAKAGFVTYSAFTTLAGFPQNVQTGCEKPS